MKKVFFMNMSRSIGIQLLIYAALYVFAVIHHNDNVAFIISILSLPAYVTVGYLSTDTKSRLLNFASFSLIAVGGVTIWIYDFMVSDPSGYLPIKGIGCALYNFNILFLLDFLNISVAVKDSVLISFVPTILLWLGLEGRILRMKKKH